MHDDGLDLPSLEIVEFGFGFYCDCKMAVFQGIHYFLISISSLISLLIILSILYYDCIDLPENDLKSIVQAYVSILFENQKSFPNLILEKGVQV